MQLFHMWKDSLKIFIPRNLKLFGLVSLNAARHAYRVWFRFFWPLFILYILSGAVAGYAPRSAALVGAVSCFGLFIAIILCVRPSVKRKTYAYFYDYRWHVALVGVLFFADYFVAMEHMANPILATHLFAPLFLVPLTVFMLFYCDTHGRLRDLFLSAWRTLKMLWYGLPFYFILIVATGIFYAGISFLLWELFFPLAYVFRTVPLNIFYGVWYSLFVQVVIFIVSVIPVAFVASFYTKKVHDYSERFLG